MTIEFNNTYLKDVSTTAGLLESKGTFGKYYDKTYNDYYLGEKTFEKAEIKMIDDAVNILLNKTNIKKEDVNVFIGSDLLNQITPNAYYSSKLQRPFLGVYNACASLCEEFIIASSLLQNKSVKNILVNTSSHNMTAERQYRNPVEYGCPKPKRSTYTVTGATCALLTKEKTNIKITSGTIGTVTDMDITDVYDMGSVMASSAARTINEHLKNTNTKPEDYDLILTGDLGIYGKKILKEYMKEEYNIILNNYEDSGSIVYNLNNQKVVNAGGSGPACIGLTLFTDVFNKLKNGTYKKVLAVATGALMSPTMNNQKLSIPSISHAVCLEVIR